MKKYSLEDARRLLGWSASNPENGAAFDSGWGARDYEVEELKARLKRLHSRLVLAEDLISKLVREYADDRREYHGDHHTAAALLELLPWLECRFRQEMSAYDTSKVGGSEDGGET